MTTVFFLLWVVTTVLWIRGTSPRGVQARSASLLRKVDMIPQHRKAIGDLEAARTITQMDHELAPTVKHNHVDCSICGPGPLFRGQVPSEFAHPFFKDERVFIHGDYGGGHWSNRLKGTLPEYADTVASTVLHNGKATGLHTVMLDLDFPATVIESSTPGHYHLYADKVIPWRRYRRMLRAMRNCGLIEVGYYNASISRRATHLRPPWVAKPGGPVPAPKGGKNKGHRWDWAYTQKRRKMNL